MDGILEVKCRSVNCKGGQKDVVVIHRFSAVTGGLIETKRYRDAVSRRDRQ